MRSFVLNSLRLLRDVKILLLHFTLNLLLFGACVVWLIIPDKHPSQLLLTAMLALAIVVAAVWLHAGTLSYAADGDGTLGKMFLRGLRHVLSVLIVILVFCFVFSWMTKIQSNMVQTSGFVFSKSPAWLRGRFGPEAFDSIGGWIVTILACYVVPGVLLPMAASAARYGFSRELPKSTIRAWSNWRYWAMLALLAITGLLIPSKLVNLSHAGSLTFETMSLILRFGCAYVLAVGSWLATAGMLGPLVASRVEVRDDVSRQPVA